MNITFWPPVPGGSSGDIPTDVSDLTDTTGIIPADVSDLTDTTGLIPTDLSELTDDEGILTAKVDVVEGKGLSTNDFTDALETKLGALPLAADIPADVSDLTDTTGLIPTDLSDITDAQQILTAGTTTITATEDLSANRFVGFGNDVCEFDARAKGVTSAEILTDAQGVIHTYGIVPVEAGEEINVGAEVSSDGSGRALVAVLGAKVNGCAVTSSTVSGDIIQVLLK